MDSNSTYEAHFHAAPCGYLVLAADGTVLDVNRTLLTWTGRSREKVLGTNVLDLMSPAHQVFYASHAVPQLAVSGSFTEVAAELVCAAGGHIPVLLSGLRSVNGTDGTEVDRITVFNASKRRHHERELVAALRKAEAAEAARAAAEEELREKQRVLEEKDRVLNTSLAASREHEALLDTVLNAIDIGLLVVDRKGGVVLANAHLLSAWNKIQGEVSRGGERPIFGPDRVTPVGDSGSPMRRAVAGESFSDQLLWFGSSVGKQQIALSVSARPIKTDGVFSGSVIAYNDVSSLVHALAAQEEFVANVSHELRTPLTSIMGYLDLALDEEGLPPAVASALTVALRNAERLLALVSDLLSVASGTMKAERRPVNLAEIVRSGIVSMAPKARAGRVEMVTDTPDFLTAEVDPRRIGQVVDNLLSNAVKYSPDGGTVRVQLSEEAQKIMLRVSDTGIGMDEAEQDKVFTKFFRAHRAVTSAVPGVGLGLVITKNIVEAHGGNLSFVSSPGQGSVFTVSLPLPAEGSTGSAR